MRKNLYRLSKAEKYEILKDLSMSTPDLIEYLIHTLDEGMRDPTRNSFYLFWEGVKTKLEEVKKLYDR
jgi:hypothetical protein